MGFQVWISSTGKIGNVVQKWSVRTKRGGPPSLRCTSHTPVSNAMAADVVTISPRIRARARKSPHFRARWCRL